MGYFRKKTLFGWKRISHFKQIDFIPKVDFDMVVKKIDSLNLFSYQTHAVDSFPRGFDIPISFYIVEFKKGDRYHQFSFNTYFPLNNDWENEYKVIEDLIFKEFPFIFYTNNK